ncbi:MAG: hypothetical protein ACREBG_01845 [Pyrinomonadaceae bacterium]
METTLQAIRNECHRQEELIKSGKFSWSCDKPGIPDSQRLTVLAEEFGEVAREVMEALISESRYDREKLRKELVQVAAVRVAWCEALEAEALTGGHGYYSKSKVSLGLGAKVNIPKMKVVYIAHPYGGLQSNREKAAKWVAWAARLGCAPIADWIILTGEFPDDIEGIRGRMLALDCNLVGRCDELWICGDHVSPGMSVEIEAAVRLNIPVVDKRFVEGRP